MDRQRMLLAKQHLFSIPCCSTNSENSVTTEIECTVDYHSVGDNPPLIIGGTALGRIHQDVITETSEKTAIPPAKNITVSSALRKCSTFGKDASILEINVSVLARTSGRYFPC